MLYRAGGSVLVDGVPCSVLLVNSQAEQDAAEGWGTAAPAEAAAEVPPVAEPTRAELEAKAEALGVKFDGRTGDKKLAALIAEKV